MTNSATISHSPTEAVRDYERYRDTRSRDRSGTNHAGQIAFECVCGNTFDVGYERFHTPAFQAHPYCHPCVIKETQQ